MLVALLGMTSCNILTRFKAVPDGSTLDPPEESMMRCEDTKEAVFGEDARLLAVQRGAQNQLCKTRHNVLVEYVEKKQQERGKK